MQFSRRVPYFFGELRGQYFVEIISIFKENSIVNIIININSHPRNPSGRRTELVKPTFKFLVEDCVKLNSTKTDKLLVLFLSFVLGEINKKSVR